MQDKILVVVKKGRKVKALELLLESFGTVNIGLAVVPIKELDSWLKVIYGYKLLSVKYRGKVVKFN